MLFSTVAVALASVTSTSIVEAASLIRQETISFEANGSAYSSCARESILSSLKAMEITGISYLSQFTLRHEASDFLNATQRSRDPVGVREGNTKPTLNETHQVGRPQRIDVAITEQVNSIREVGVTVRHSELTG